MRSRLKTMCNEHAVQSGHRGGPLHRSSSLSSPFPESLGRMSEPLVSAVWLQQHWGSPSASALHLDFKESQGRWYSPFYSIKQPIPHACLTTSGETEQKTLITTLYRRHYSHTWYKKEVKSRENAQHGQDHIMSVDLLQSPAVPEKRAWAQVKPTRQLTVTCSNSKYWSEKGDWTKSVSY